MSAAATTDIYSDIAAALIALLKPYEGRLDLVDTPSADYYLQTKKPAVKKRPLMFAGVRVGKAYVSYHLVPVYMDERLKAPITPALRKRMQGKACFNFKAMPESALLDELRTLTEAGFRSFESAGYI